MVPKGKGVNERKSIPASKSLCTKEWIKHRPNDVKQYSKMDLQCQRDGEKADKRPQNDMRRYFAQK